MVTARCIGFPGSALADGGGNFLVREYTFVAQPNLHSVYQSLSQPAPKIENLLAVGGIEYAKVDPVDSSLVSNNRQLRSLNNPAALPFTIEECDYLVDVWKGPESRLSGIDATEKTVARENVKGQLDSHWDSWLLDR